MTHQSLPRQPFQFRLAGLLWAVTILAILAAAAAPFLRHWTASHWYYFGLGVLTFSLAAVAMVGVNLLDRRSWQRRIRRLGTPVIRVTNVTLTPQPFAVRFYPQYGMLCIVAFASCLFISVGELHIRGKLTLLGFEFAILAGANFASAINLFLRPAAQVFLGPAGVATQLAVNPWETIQINTEDNCLRFDSGRGFLLEVKLTPDEMAIVEAWHLAAKK